MISGHISWMSTSCEIVLWWMPHNTFDYKSALVDVMNWSVRQQSITWISVDLHLCHHMKELIGTYGRCHILCVKYAFWHIGLLYVILSSKWKNILVTKWNVTRNQIEKHIPYLTSMVRLWAFVLDYFVTEKYKNNHSLIYELYPPKNSMLMCDDFFQLIYDWEVTFQ